MDKSKAFEEFLKNLEEEIGDVEEIDEEDLETLSKMRISITRDDLLFILNESFNQIFGNQVIPEMEMFKLALYVAMLKVLFEGTKDEYQHKIDEISKNEKERIIN